MRWIVFFVITLLALSCSKEQESEQIKSASLKVNINSESLNSGSTTKAGTYVRGNAPVYIEGVRLTAEHRRADDVVHEFLFVEMGNIGGKDVVMTGLREGWNTISAKGICANEPVRDWNDTDFTKSWNTPQVELKDYNDMAADYSAILKGIFPVYADYSSENSARVNVRNGNLNEVSLNMVTDNHRFAVAIENASDDYTIRCRVIGFGREFYKELYNKGTCFGVVYNDDDYVGTKNVTVRIEYQSRITWVKETFEKTYTVNGGQDITRYFRFNKGVVEGGSFSANITWVPLNDNIGGENVF